MTRFVTVVGILTLVACSPAGTSPAGGTGAPTTVRGEACADVIDVDITPAGDTFTVAATVRSSDTGWEKYADRWEVRTLDGHVVAVRELAHPHETEQPFTRSLSGVAIPAYVGEVEVWAHDSVAGFCGRPFRVTVPERP